MSLQTVVFLDLIIFINSLLSFVEMEMNDVGRICKLTEELNTVLQKPIRKPSLQKIVMGQIVLPSHLKKIHMLKWSPVRQNEILLGDRVFKEVLKLKRDGYNGLSSSMIGILIRRNVDTDNIVGRQCGNREDGHLQAREKGLEQFHTSQLSGRTIAANTLIADSSSSLQIVNIYCSNCPVCSTLLQQL